MAASLFVFLPSDTRKDAVQQAIMQACPAFQVSVFERASRFWRAHEKMPADAVITSGLTFSHLTNYTPVASGAIKAQGTSSHRLISITRPPPDLKKLGDSKVGALGELDRIAGRTFYRQALAPAVKMKLASKPRDLMPLLTFNTVDYLLVDQRTFYYLKQISKQQLQTRDIEMNMLAAVGAVRKNGPTSLQSTMAGCLEKLNSLSYNQAYFLIDTWQRR